VTHACSLEFLALDPNGLQREINKYAVGSFLKELKLTSSDGTPFFEKGFDRNLIGAEDSKHKLGMIMPLLNSVQLYCRYK